MNYRRISVATFIFLLFVGSISFAAGPVYARPHYGPSHNSTHNQSSKILTWAENISQPALGTGININTASSVLETSDHGFILSGSTYSYGNGGTGTPQFLSNIWTIKLNSLGHVMWDKTYNSNTRQFSIKIVKAGSHGYVVLGSTFCDHNWCATILKIDQNGNLLWQKTYATPGAASVGGAIQSTNDGGFIISGGTAQNSTYGSLWIFKIDSMGNVTWQRTYGSFYNEGSSFDTNLLVMKNGYAVSTSTFGGGSHATPDIYLLRLDLSGNIMWQSMFLGWGTSLAKTINDGIIVASTSSFQLGPGNGWITRLDYYGNTLWAMNYARPMHFGTGFSAIESTRDGGFIVGGGETGIGTGVTSSPYASYPWLVKIDGSGKILWQRTFTFGGLGTILQTSDDGYIGIGSSSSALSVLKLDSLGHCCQKITGGANSTAIKMDNPLVPSQISQVNLTVNITVITTNTASTSSQATVKMICAPIHDQVSEDSGNDNDD